MNLNITMETKHVVFPWEFKMLKNYNQYSFLHISMRLSKKQ